MRIVVKLAVAAALLAAFFLLFRTKILWLDSFDGTVTERLEEAVPTVIEGKHTQKISDYFLRIRTDDGRDVTVEVPQLVYFRSREGMRVSKPPFRSSIELLP